MGCLNFELFVEFFELCNCGLLPKKFTFAILSACAKSVEVNYGKQIHVLLIRLDLR